MNLLQEGSSAQASADKKAARLNPSGLYLHHVSPSVGDEGLEIAPDVPEKGT